MSIKKTLSVVGASSYQSPHQRLWLAIKANADDFTIDAAAKVASIKIESARTFIRGLLSAEIIQESYTEQVDRCRKKHYKLIKDVGYNAPVMSRQTDTVNKAIWNTLRITRTWISAYELSKLNSNEDIQVTENAAETYLKALYLAGYVKADFRHYAGVKRTKYQLIAKMNGDYNNKPYKGLKRIVDSETGKTRYQIPLEAWDEALELDSPIECIAD